DATDNSVILSMRFSSGNGMVLVITNSLMADSSILFNAGPDSTGWVQQAYTSFAPLSTSALAAMVIVPAVSMISSIKIAVLPSISPMIFMTSATFGLGRSEEHTSELQSRFDLVCRL